MFVWSVSRAASAVRENRVSEWDKAKYLIATAVTQLVVAGVSGVAFDSQRLGLAEALGYVASIIVTVVGIVWLFRMNQERGGDDFVARYVVLSLPATVRVTGAYWFLLATLSVLVATRGWPAASSSFWAVYPAFVVPLFSGAFIWQLSVGFRQL